MPGTDRLTIRVAGPAMTWVAAGTAVLAGVLAVTGRSVWLAAWAVLFAVQVVVQRWNATVLTPSHLEARSLRRRLVPWADVTAVRATTSVRRVEALLADGSTLTLPGVLWRGRRAEGSAPPRSAQAVAEWARARGHDVALVGD
jgi:hypothetical protein